MEKTLDLSRGLGRWIDREDHPTFESVLVETVRLAQRHGFDFPNQDSFDAAVPRLINDQYTDDDEEIDFIFLVTDAVDYLNSLSVITNGYIFSLKEGSLILEQWSK